MLSCKSFYEIGLLCRIFEMKDSNRRGTLLNVTINYLNVTNNDMILFINFDDAFSLEPID